SVRYDKHGKRGPIAPKPHPTRNGHKIDATRPPPTIIPKPVERSVVRKNSLRYVSPIPHSQPSMPIMIPPKIRKVLKSSVRDATTVQPIMISAPRMPAGRRPTRSDNPVPTYERKNCTT